MQHLNITLHELSDANSIRISNIFRLMMPHSSVFP